jgi:hypothetical protein
VPHGLPGEIRVLSLVVGATQMVGSILRSTASGSRVPFGMGKSGDARMGFFTLVRGAASADNVPATANSRMAVGPGGFNRWMQHT